MGEKRRYGNWDRAKFDDGEQWPSKSSRRWGQQNNARFNGWKVGEGSSKPDSNGWGDCHPTVPSWVRAFCTSICGVPWRKICDARRMLSIHKNIAEWDDSACREAFENAKTLYWAKINRLPCDLPLPDPYMYIDKVNFDTFIDPVLAADLERSTINLDTDNEAVINHSDAAVHEPVPATGDGEAQHSPTNWDKYIEKPTSRWDEVALCDPWEGRRNQSVDVDGRRESLWKHRSWNDMEDSWKHDGCWKNVHDRRNGGWNCMNSRHQMADDQTNRRWKDSNSFQRNAQIHPQSTWHRGEFLETRNHQRTSYLGAPWQRENAVS